MEKLIIPSILSVNDVIPLAARILKITQLLADNDIRIRDLHTTVSRIHERLVKNQKNTGKSLLNEELYLLDKRRDKALMSLSSVIRGLSLSILDDTSNKASKLYTLFDKYGISSYKAGFKTEKGILTALFSDFDLPGNQKLLADLNIKPLYESLKGAHEAFETVSCQVLEEINSCASESEAATRILEEMFPALSSLVSMIQLYYQFEPNRYATIYHHLLSCINEVNETARSHQHRGPYRSDAPQINTQMQQGRI